MAVLMTSVEVSLESIRPAGQGLSQRRQDGRDSKSSTEESTTMLHKMFEWSMLTIEIWI